jgi:hypothetical protein
MRKLVLALALVVAACASQSGDKIAVGARDECVRRNIPEGTSEFSTCLRDVSDAINAARRYERPPPERPRPAQPSRPHQQRQQPRSSGGYPG